jgi:hypothetical protein
MPNGQPKAKAKEKKSWTGYKVQVAESAIVVGQYHDFFAAATSKPTNRGVQRTNAATQRD